MDSRRKTYWPPARGTSPRARRTRARPVRHHPETSQASTRTAMQPRAMSPNDEDAGPDHRPRDEHRRVGQGHRFDESGAGLRRGVVGRPRCSFRVRKKREGVGGGCRRRFRCNPTKCRGALGLPLDRGAPNPTSCDAVQARRSEPLIHTVAHEGARVRITTSDSLCVNHTARGRIRALGLAAVREPLYILSDCHENADGSRRRRLLAFSAP